MEKKVTIRRALAADAEAVLSVLKRSVRDGCLADHKGDSGTIDRWLANKTIQNLTKWFQSENPVLVAEMQSSIMGVAMLRVDGQILLFYVAPEFHRRGAGRALLVALEEEATHRRLSSLSLSSTKTAHDFYLRNGFIDTGRQQEVLGMKVSVLEKTLAEHETASS
jgi:GNAT superfamily N-acetyltransferase